MTEARYKLLAADDEYWSREKLRTMLDWKRYGIEFLEPAEDGEQALERIENERPDILIADVNMPIIDGAALMEHVAAKYPDMVSFIVSGYDDFMYVKRTMRSGAINYLLKPVSKLELISAVSEALEKIDEQRAASQRMGEQQKQLKTAASILRDRELSALLDKRASGAPRRLSVNVDLGVMGRGFVLIKIHDMTKALNDYRQDVYGLSYRAKAKLRELTDDKTLIFNHFTRTNEYMLLTDGNQAQTETSAKRYADVLGGMFDSPVTVVLCGGAYSMDELNAAYTQALSYLRERRYFAQSLIVNRSTERCKDDARLTLNAEQGSKIAARVCSGNRKAALDAVLNDSGLSGLGSLDVSCGAVEQLVRQLGGIMRAQMPSDSGSGDIAAVEGLMDEAQKCVETLDIRQLMDCESAITEAVTTSRPVEQNDSMRAVVRQAKEFIDKNCYMQVTLSGLAESYHVDSSYLSRCFKQETGENLMLYLAKKRIERAEELIKEGELGLSEIAFLTGYDDYTYFSRVFKKHKGESPSEYRAKLQSGEERV